MAIFKHHRYLADDYSEITRFCEVGCAPEVVEEGGRRYELRERPDEARPLAVKKTITGFVSRSLPKHWPYAPRHVQAGKQKGACVFRNRKEVDEAVALANAHGENVTYDY